MYYTLCASCAHLLLITSLSAVLGMMRSQIIWARKQTVRRAVDHCWMKKAHPKMTYRHHVNSRLITALEEAWGGGYKSEKHFSPCLKLWRVSSLKFPCLTVVLTWSFSTGWGCAQMALQSHVAGVVQRPTAQPEWLTLHHELEPVPAVPTRCP